MSRMSFEKQVESRQGRAHKVVEQLGVKLHKFTPSGREIWTVVGGNGDSLVDEPKEGQHSFCSCDDFHFRVARGEVSECYHMIALRTAKDSRHYSTITFSDEEYAGFLRGLIIDIFSNIT